MNYQECKIDVEQRNILSLALYMQRRSMHDQSHGISIQERAYLDISYTARKLKMMNYIAQKERKRIAA